MGECDLIAKRQGGKRERGYLYTGNGSFRTDRGHNDTTHLIKLVMSADDDAAVTFTCTPPGSGVRMGIDRDEDGVLDGEVASRHARSGRHIDNNFNNKVVTLGRLMPAFFIQAGI